MINLKPLNNFEFGDYVNIIYDIELENKKNTGTANHVSYQRTFTTKDMISIFPL